MKEKTPLSFDALLEQYDQAVDHHAADENAPFDELVDAAQKITDFLHSHVPPENTSMVRKGVWTPHTWGSLIQAQGAGSVPPPFQVRRLAEIAERQVCSGSDLESGYLQAGLIHLVTLENRDAIQRCLHQCARFEGIEALRVFFEEASAHDRVNLITNFDSSVLAVNYDLRFHIEEGQFSELYRDICMAMHTAGIREISAENFLSAINALRDCAKRYVEARGNSFITTYSPDTHDEDDVDNLAFVRSAFKHLPKGPPLEPLTLMGFFRAYCEKSQPEGRAYAFGPNALSLLQKKLEARETVLPDKHQSYLAKRFIDEAIASKDWEDHK